MGYPKAQGRNSKLKKDLDASCFCPFLRFLPTCHSLLVHPLTLSLSKNRPETARSNCNSNLVSAQWLGTLGSQHLPWSISFAFYFLENRKHRFVSVSIVSTFFFFHFFRISYSYEFSCMKRKASQRKAFFHASLLLHSLYLLCFSFIYYFYIYFLFRTGIISAFQAVKKIHSKNKLLTLCHSEFLCLVMEACTTLKILIYLSG